MPGTTASSCCCPATRRPASIPRCKGARRTRPASSPGWAPTTLREVGLRLEDKGPIQALHWRGAEDDRAAEARAHEIAAEAGRARPGAALGAQGARAASAGRWRQGRGGGGAAGHDGVTAAVYAGDDRTDLDAFRRLRELRESGELETAVCVGVVSDEGPREIAEEADLTVDGPAGWLALLEALAE